MYITYNPEHCSTPEDPEMSRLLTPQTVAAVHFILNQNAEQEPDRQLSAEQMSEVLRRIESWLEKQDQGFADQVTAIADQVRAEKS